MAEEKKEVKEAPKPAAAKEAPKGKEVKEAPKPKVKKKPTAYKKGRFCPRCGAGVRLAEHKDRWACGKCSYMEKK